MCTVSMVADYYRPTSIPAWLQRAERPYDKVSRAEYEKLKQELEALKILLKAAKVFDEATGQKDCQKDEKVALLKDMAKALDVDLEGIV